MSKYAVIRKAALDEDRVFISPTQVFDIKLAHQRAQFSIDAYKESFVVIELRVVKEYGVEE